MRYHLILAALFCVASLPADEVTREDEAIFQVEVLFRQEGVWFLGQASVPKRKVNRPVFRAAAFDADGQLIMPNDPGRYWTRWDDRGLVLCVSDQGFHPMLPEKLDRPALFSFQDALFHVASTKEEHDPVPLDVDHWQQRVKEVMQEAIAADDSRVRSWLVAQGIVQEAELLLPRLAHQRGNQFKDHPGLGEALATVPSLIAQDALFSFAFGKGNLRTDGFLMQASFDPAQADVGKIAKAVDAFRGAGELRSQPPAILLVRATPGKEPKAVELEQVWKALDEVDGVDVKRSRTLVAGHILGIALKPDGKASLGKIRSAFDSAGVQLEREQKSPGRERAIPPTPPKRL